jgi:hypothetical protein
VDHLGIDTFSRRVLLTGAGFTKNWGGFLATEVWDVIFGRVSGRRALRDLLLQQRLFEEALGEARAGGYSADDVAALEAAVVGVFDQMDQQLRQPGGPVSSYTANELVSKFCRGPVGVGTGNTFTLNQDLLLERICGLRVDRQKLTIPGIRWSGPATMFPAGSAEIPSAFVTDPDSGRLPQLRGNFNLIKLHGSRNWRAAGGSASMVVGTGKPATIAASPLLAWCHRIFEEVLCLGDVRLMVIGYGWGDEHINAVIAKAVRDHGLELFVWAPTHAPNAISVAPCGPDILPGLMGVATRPMAEVMPEYMNNKTPEYHRIVREFFS